jgi:cell division protein FtsL
MLAVGLQLVNENTNMLETTYEIITFLTAFACVVMAVMQGIVNARTTRELTHITREIRELMQNVERDERRDANLKREIKKDLELDREAIEMIQEKKQQNKQ